MLEMQVDTVLQGSVSTRTILVHSGVLDVRTGNDVLAVTGASFLLFIRPIGWDNKDNGQWGVSVSGLGAFWPADGKSADDFIAVMTGDGPQTDAFPSKITLSEALTARVNTPDGLAVVGRQRAEATE